MTPTIRNALEKAGVITPEKAGRGGYADPAGRTVLLDQNCADDGKCMQLLGDDEFWKAHEIGHVLYFDIKMPFGLAPTSQEYGANCIAEVLTGRGPNFTDDPNGYSDCTPSDVAKIRRMMVFAGIADDHRSRLDAERNL